MGFRPLRAGFLINTHSQRQQQIRTHLQFSKSSFDLSGHVRRKPLNSAASCIVLYCTDRWPQCLIWRWISKFDAELQVCYHTDICVAFNAYHAVLRGHYVICRYVVPQAVTRFLNGPRHLRCS